MTARKGMRCFFDPQHGLQCTIGGQPSQVPNESLQPGCYVNTKTNRWVCPSVPPLHGKRVSPQDPVHEPTTGQRWAHVDGDTPVVAFPFSVGHKKPKPSSTASTAAMECCYDANAGTLVCSGSKLDGLPVEVVAHFDYLDGRKGVSVVSDVLKGGGTRVPVCRPPIHVDPPEGCCVAEETMQIVCEDPSHPWHGVYVRHEATCHIEENGHKFCTVELGGASITLPMCKLDACCDSCALGKSCEGCSCEGACDGSCKAA